VARAFHEEREKQKLHDSGTYMVLPCKEKDKAYVDKVESGMAYIDSKNNVMFKEWDFGKTLFLGNSVEERETLMSVNPVNILIEGGDAAGHESTKTLEVIFGNQCLCVLLPVTNIRTTATVGCPLLAATDKALKNLQGGRYVIPVVATGGASKTIGERMKSNPVCRDMKAEKAWSLLQTVDEAPGKTREKAQDIGKAVATMVESLHDNLIKLQEQQDVIPLGPPSNEKPDGMQVLQSMSDLVRYRERFEAAYVLQGHGIKRQVLRVLPLRVLAG